MTSSRYAILVAVAAAVIGCGRNADLVGRPLSEGERREAYRAVLVSLSDTLRLKDRVLRPALCLDRGIYAVPFGAHVEDHAAGWLDDLADDRVIEAVADHSAAACPDESYWIALSNTELLAEDSVAVPLTLQRVVRRAGPRADRTARRAIVLDDGGWRIVDWR